MGEKHVPRRLAAILAADIVGYSRLMEADEADTLATLKARRREVLEPLVAKYHGRVFKTTGDGVLVEFASAVHAAQCAVELQQGMAAANAGRPEDRHIVLRVGIHLADVMVEGADLYGEGVNIAARLETLANPGGICVSAKLRDEINRKLNLIFDDLGEHRLKNVSAPVRVYAARSSDAEASRPALVLPRKPSIAVLPFTNMSSDPEQEFFADGMTEDLITALSRIGELFVISRNSSFVFKGRAHRLDLVARELGVRYVLEGSIRVSGKNVRITAQLIDGQSGHHVWAERYDGRIDDVFKLQDDITRNIAVAMQIKLTYGELARLWDGQTKDLRAWEKMVLARELFLKFDPISNSQARHLLEEALTIDPAYTGAMVQLGLTYWMDGRFNSAADKDSCLLLAEQQADNALKIDPNMGSAHMLRGGIAFLRDQHELAIQQCQRGTELAPSDSWAMAFLAMVLVYAGEPEKAIVAVKSAMRLSPHYPYWYDYVYALASLWAGDLAAAEAAAELDRKNESDPPTYINLALAYAFQNKLDDAARAISDLRIQYPNYTMKDVLHSERYRERDKIERVVDVLRSAGLPD